MRNLPLVADPDRFVAWATHWGHLSVIKWLGSYGIFPNSAALDGAAENGHLDVVKWLMSQGIRPGLWSIQYAAMNGHVDMVEWLSLHGVPVTTHAANLAAKNNHMIILEWMKCNQGILPDQNGMLYAEMTGAIGSIKWMQQQGQHDN